MQGHVYKRGKTWTYTVDLGKNPATGKRQQKSKGGFKTKKEAQAASIKAQQEINEETFVDEQAILFKDFADQWLNMYASSVKVSSVRVRKIEMKRLCDYFGYVKLKDINGVRYQKVLYDLQQKGYSNSSIDGVHSTGRMIFKKALEFELIKKNPTEFAKVPRKIDSVQELETRNKDIKYLEKHELAAFLKAAKNEGLQYDHLIFSLLAYSGMRAGELLALKWNDINFNESTINITKTLYNPKNREKEFELLTPKTSGSVRKIKIDEDILSLLKKHKKEQTEWKMMTRDEYVDQNFIITRMSGYPETIKKIAIRMKRLLKLIKIERNLTPHSFRHTHTSLLIEAGVGIKEIQQRLGHTDIETTMNIYAHMTKEMEEKASHKFSELMRSLK